MRSRFGSRLWVSAATILTTGRYVTVYDTRPHNCCRNRAHNWVHFRIWRSRDCFLSTSPTRKTAIAPFLRDSVYRTTRAVACNHRAARACTCSAQAVRCRRRHQPRRPAPAMIRPGRPAPAIGPGTDDVPLATSEILCVNVLTIPPALVSEKMPNHLCQFAGGDSYIDSAGGGGG